MFKFSRLEDMYFEDSSLYDSEVLKDGMGFSFCTKEDSSRRSQKDTLPLQISFPEHDSNSKLQAKGQSFS